MNRYNKIIWFDVILFIVFILLLLISCTKAINIQEIKQVEKIFYTENKIFNTKCSVPLYKIAYWFWVLESGLCKFWLSVKSKNCWSLHHTPKSVYYNRRNWKSYLHKTEPLRIYSRNTAWAYDFMFLYYYAYWCKIDLHHIKYYICGKWKCAIAKEYFKKLIKLIK